MKEKIIEVAKIVGRAFYGIFIIGCGFVTIGTGAYSIFAGAKICGFIEDK